MHELTFEANQGQYSGLQLHCDGADMCESKICSVF